MSGGVLAGDVTPLPLTAAPASGDLYCSEQEAAADETSDAHPNSQHLRADHGDNTIDILLCFYVVAFF
eukprot:CAMPEP_0179965408 /NCGR_PEP_ID=MMETSP0983-20121128/31880_1 /TAXON_ID=483367 /ORGANISM="non described non described, Strain CCMP 2436" /LENGTH=67 /DNA_ID=CAMNT_0021878267 /DNA_START=91 /DNA_END=294 /DNA_ORIENTATION=+